MRTGSLEWEVVISDILEMSNVFNMTGYIVRGDIEKAFDSLSHSFPLACLKKIGFGHDFIRWFKILLASKESCITNAGITISYFNLGKGIRFLCIFLFYVLKFYFCMLKLNIKFEA